MANLPKNLTPKELEEIETMAGLGLRFEDIARMKGISIETLRKYAKEQLNRGKAKAKAAVMQTAFKMAVAGKHPAMTMFWLKTQAGWRENMPEENPVQDELTGGLDEFLQKTIEQVKSGHVDPKVASTIASLSNVLLKATEQADLEERLASLERVLITQPKPGESLMNTALDSEADDIEFVSEEEA